MDKDKIKKLLEMKEKKEQKYKQLEDKLYKTDDELRMTKEQISRIESDLHLAYKDDFEDTFREWLEQIDVEKHANFAHTLTLSRRQALKAQFIIETGTSSNSAVGGQFTFEITPTSLGNYVVMHNTATGKRYDLTEDF